MDYRNTVAVLVIVYYTFIFGAATFLIQRHGWRSSYETWFVVAMFSLSRLGYGAIQLSTIAHPDSNDLRITAATFAVDGLAPLLFSSMGLLRRLLDLAQLHGHQTYLRLVHLRFLEALITASFICAAIGFSSLSDQDVLDGIPKHANTTKAAAIMYLIVTSGVALGTVAILSQRAYIEAGEQKVLFALIVSQPLVFVRSIYMALDMLADIQTFNAIDGSVTAFLCMALLEEAIVITGYLAIGFNLRIITKQELQDAMEAHKKQDMSSEGDFEMVDLCRDPIRGEA